MKVVEQFLIVADCGEVPLIFRVLQRDLFLRQPVPIDASDQLLIFLSQPLFELLYFLVVHLGRPLSARPSWPCHKT